MHQDHSTKLTKVTLAASHSVPSSRLNFKNVLLVSTLAFETFASLSRSLNTYLTDGVGNIPKSVLYLPFQHIHHQLKDMKVFTLKHYFNDLYRTQLP